jgi:Carboxypeptidase regulatory-like domain
MTRGGTAPTGWTGLMLALACCLLGALRPIDAGAAQVGGTVTNQLTGLGVGGIAVTLDPPADGPVVTDSSGAYGFTVPSGTYDVSFADDRFQALDQTGIAVPSMGSVTLDVALVPLEPVIVSAELVGDPVPGAVLAANVDFEILDGSSFVGIEWTQSQSVEVTLDNADTANATVTLPGVSAYKDELLRVLANPPIGPDELPPNVPPPPDEFPGGLQDRFQVVGVNPFALEEAGLVTIQVAVTTSSGVYTDELEIHAALPFKRAGSIRNVPLGIPVLLHGKAPPGGGMAVYDWVLARPPGSSASLDDATSQSPWFVPDVAGKYTATVTDPNTSEPVVLEIWSGAWHGVITGQDGDGKPLADDCTFCHNDVIAPDQFSLWAQTGHAEIFSTLLDTNSHNSTSCFSCHSVGYDPDVDNGGLDDAVDYPDFLAAGLIGNPGDNWSTMLADYPASAHLANVQCESCHGPQGSSAHGRNTPRITLAADACGVCHGDPLRHGRFQQWQLSGHANYELAIEEGGSSSGDSCWRCHTSNGFLAWLPILVGDVPGDPTADVARPADFVAADDAHPQTCVTCHDPHQAGTMSGDNTDAKIRISGDTPPLIAGFTAANVGKGAICMTCHNTRRGPRNDDNFDAIAGTSETTRSPHPGAQADVLMGQNAYFVPVGTRGSHAGPGVQDTCVQCHMRATDPPPLLSYNKSGTNHTFYASPEICSDCHSDRVAEDYQIPFDASLAELQDKIESAILAAMDAQFAGGRAITLGGTTLTAPAEIADLELSDSQGRLAIAVQLTAGGTAGPTGLNSVAVEQDASDLGDLWEFLDDRLLRAGWNWALLTSEGSRGVHNNAFETAVLDASIAAVEAVPEPGATASLGAACAALASLAARARRR